MHKIFTHKIGVHAVHLASSRTWQSFLWALVCTWQFPG